MSTSNDDSILKHLQLAASQIYSSKREIESRRCHQDPDFTTEGLSEKELAAAIHQYYQDMPDDGMNKRSLELNQDYDINKKMRHNLAASIKAEISDIFPILNLPQTAFRIVLSFLSLVDKHNFRLVSKEFDYHITSLCKSLRKWKIDLSGEEDCYGHSCVSLGENILGLMNAKAKQHQTPKQLEIKFEIILLSTFLDYNIKRLVYSDWIEYITSLRIDISENEMIIMEHGVYFPNLRSLKLGGKGVKEIKNMDTVSRVFKLFLRNKPETLEHLELIEFSVVEPSNSLDLTGCDFKFKKLFLHNSTELICQPIFDLNKNTVETLDINGSKDKHCKFLCKEVLLTEFVGDYCPNLQHLLMTNIKKYSAYSNILTANSYTSLQNLVTLKLFQCGGGEDLHRDLSEVNFPSLKTLWIDHEEFLWLLPKCCKSLMYLFVYVNPKDLTYAIHLPNLQELYIARKVWPGNFNWRLIEQNVATLQVLLFFKLFSPEDLGDLFVQMPKLRLIIHSPQNYMPSSVISKYPHIRICKYNDVIPALNTKLGNYAECPSFWDELLEPYME